MTRISFWQSKNVQRLLIIAGLGLFILSGVYIYYVTQGNGNKQFSEVTPTAVPTTIQPTGTNTPKPDIEVVAQDLTVPWDIEFLPGGEMLVTERDGRLVKIAQDKQVIPISGVYQIGEAGLLGIALDPQFEKNNYIYLYMTVKSGNKSINQINRYRLAQNTVEEKKIILTNIPAANNHDGGQLAFGPDKKLYATTGDAQVPENAQKLTSLSGKILRLNADGSIPTDNPFANSHVYSYGHRNPQGLVWDDAGNLWAAEHGRSGALSGYDEINKIQAGKNYGWPTIQGSTTRTNMVTPVLNSGATATWAPSGIAYFKNTLFFAGLRGEALYSVKISGLKLERHFYKQYGRLRAAVMGPDGFLYISTSNKDGRGNQKSHDDKIIRINPEILL